MVTYATAVLEIGSKAIPVQGRNTFHIKGEGRSSRAMDFFFKVRDDFETYIDMEAIVPLKFIKKIEEGGYKSTDFVTFDHNKNVAFSKKGSMAFPQFSQDLISVLYYARTLDYQNAKPGDLFPIVFYFDNQIYNFKLKYLGKDEIRTDLGKFKAIKLQPQLIVDRVFKDSDDMTIWISDDENLIPLRVESEIMIGSMRGDITGYSGLRNPVSSRIKN